MGVTHPFHYGNGSLQTQMAILVTLSAPQSSYRQTAASRVMWSAGSGHDKVPLPPAEVSLGPGRDCCRADVPNSTTDKGERIFRCVREGQLCLYTWSKTTRDAVRERCTLGVLWAVFAQYGSFCGGRNPQWCFSRVCAACWETTGGKDLLSGFK